jgi:oxygen tolerance protein BatD
MKSWSVIIVALLGLAISSLANAAVSASLDSNEIAPGDSVQLTLLHDGRTRDEPDLSPLDKDFDVLGRQSSTSIQIVNGSASASTQLTLTLSPKHSGALTVPSLTWSGERTKPLTLNVASGAGGQGSGQSTDEGQARSANVFLETEVDSKQPFVQAAVNVTVKLYVAERLYQANLDLQGSSDAIVRKVGEDEQSEAIRDGRSYQVVTRHYLVFPQHSGTIKLGGAVLSAQVADRRRSSNDPFAGVFGGSPFGNVTSTRPVRLHGDDITLEVQPRPAGFESGYWLPARQVTLEGEWSPANAQAHVGDPITLTLRLQAEGQAAAQLPDLSTLLELPGGVKAYPDQAKLDDSTKGVDVVGTRSQSIALIADEAGRFSIPELKVRWWDTRTGQPRETTLPARTLVILPGSGAPSTSTAVNPATSASAAGDASANPGATSSSGPNVGGGSQGAGVSQGKGAPAASAGTRANDLANQRRGEEAPWRWIAWGLGMLWVATLTAWFGSRRLWWKRLGWKGKAGSSTSSATADASTGGADVPQARAAFEAACSRNDALAARRALLAWVRACSPHSPSAGLNALAKQVDDPVLAALVRGLDRACYAGESWQGGEALANALRELPTLKGVVEKRRGGSPLAPLYP